MSAESVKRNFGGSANGVGGKDEQRMWGNPEALKELAFKISGPPVDIALPRRLGTPSFCKSPDDFWKIISAVYNSATALAIDLASK